MAYLNDRRTRTSVFYILVATGIIITCQEPPPETNYRKKSYTFEAIIYGPHDATLHASQTHISAILNLRTTS